MTTANSAAAPDALQHYVDVSAALAPAMSHEQALLAAALAQFGATCTEYRVPALDGLVAQINAHEQRASSLAEWVTAVASGFRSADSGGIGAAPSSGLDSRPLVMQTHLRISLRGPQGLHLNLRLQLRAVLPGRLQAIRLIDKLARLDNVAPRLIAGLAVQGIGTARRWLIEQATQPRVVQFGTAALQMLRIAGVTLSSIALGAQQFAAARPAQRTQMSLGVVLATIKALGLQAPLQAALHDTQQVLWAGAGLTLLLALQQANQRNDTNPALVTVGGVPMFGDLAVPLLLAAAGIVGLSVVGDKHRWQDLPDGDGLIALITRAFWIESQQFVPPGLLHAIAEQVETLNRTIAATNGSHGHPRPIPLERMPDGRVLNTDLDATFPPEYRIPRDDGTYALQPGVLMSGEQALISYYQGEQITLVRVGADDFVIGICGLDPKNMAHAPNGLSAVIETANDPTTYRNDYYAYIREQFFHYLELIPPGSNIHLTGHSMGAGMTMLLLSDPVVLAALREHDITPLNMTTVGAVRPEGVTEQLPPNLNQQHYVDPDDQLAMNVGAGHANYPGVILIDNGSFTDPVAAHSGYNEADYSALPDDLAHLPFVVDPAYYAVYRLPTVDPPPAPWLAAPPPELPPLYP